MQDEKEPHKLLTELIRDADLTFQDVAEVLNYHRATIRERKKNPEQFTVQEIVVIAKLLKKTPTAILKTILRELKEDGSLIADFEQIAIDFLERRRTKPY